MTTFFNTSGDDVFAGSGSDTVDYSGAGVFVTVDLTKQGAPQNTGSGNDTLSGIANITGTGHLIGDANANVLVGGNGNNIFEGGGGADTILGGRGDDTFIFHTGDLVPGEYDDGGLGTNTLQVSGSVDFTVGTVFNFARLVFADDAGASGTAIFTAGGVPATVVGGAGADTLVIHTSPYVAIEANFPSTFSNWGAQDTIALVGSSADETFKINTQLPGSYSITTGGGHDVIALNPVTGTFQAPTPIVVNGFQSGWGGDRLSLGPFLASVVPHYDMYASYPDALAAARLRLLASGADTLVQFDQAGTGAWATLITLKGVDPSSFLWYNLGLFQAGGGLFPPVVGASAGAVVTGSLTAGNVLNGTAGDDTLIGGPFADVFHGGPGSDYITGGGGLDVSLYDGVFRSYTVFAGSQIMSVAGGPEGGTDTLSGVARAQFVDGYITTSTSDFAAQVYRVYGATLGRAPDAAGLTNWTHALENGASLQSIVNGFVGSTEFQTKYGALNNTGFLTLLYANVLDRPPDTTGMNSWLSLLAAGHSRAEVVLGFSESAEYITELTNQVVTGLWVGDAGAAQVARLYDTTLRRLPDTSGLSNWTHALDSGAETLLQVAQGVVGSAEFQSVYGNLSDSQFVQQLYLNTLHRGADPGGLSNWVNFLAAGHSRAEVVIGFSESNEHIANLAPHIDHGVWVAS
jgi:hypothetical protein